MKQLSIVNPWKGNCVNAGEGGGGQDSPRADFDGLYIFK